RGCTEKSDCKALELSSPNESCVRSASRHCSRAALLNREKPALTTTRQHVRSAILERDSGTGDKILHCARYQHFTCLRFVCDTHAHLSRSSTNLTVNYLALARVQTGARLNAQPGSVFSYRGGATNRARRPVKYRKQTILENVDLPPSKPFDLFRHVRVQTPE